MALGDRIIVPAMAAGFYSLLGSIAKGTGDTLNLPEGMVNIGGNGLGYLLAAQTNWDPAGAGNNDGSLSMTLGDDVYIYVVQDASGTAQWVASNNSTVPTGYNADNSRKVGGFHVGKTRPYSERFNAAYSAPTEIVWNSCWDLQHRPTCDPSGMVEVIAGSLWCDIYLASEGAGTWPDIEPLSVHNATPLTGIEGYSRFHDQIRLARNVGKRLPTYTEMAAAAYGVPQGATGNTGRQSTGDHTGYGFSAVSCLNVDQPVGNVWQPLLHIYDRDTAVSAWYDFLNSGMDSAHDHGQWRGADFNFSTFGGKWDESGEAGARCVNLGNSPWSVTGSDGLRSFCESL
nr:hypothetical protein 19 [Saccharospirillaceae bacterium]